LLHLPTSTTEVITTVSDNAVNGSTLQT